MNFSRQNPLQIFSKIWGPMLVLFIPLGVQIFLTPKNINSIIFSAAVNIILTLAMFLYYFLTWLSSGVGVKYGTAKTKNGFIVSKKREIPIRNIVSVEIERTIFTAIFGSVRVYLRTPAKSKKPDEAFYIRRKKQEKLKKHLGWCRRVSAESLYRAKNLSVLMMAFSGSNAAAGLLLSVPFLKIMGQIFNENLAEDLLYRISDSLAAILPFLDPITGVISALFFGGWLVNFFDVIFRYSNFYAWCSGKHIFTRSGLIARRSLKISREKIYIVDVRETLLTKIFSLSSVYLMAEGYEKRKEQKIPLVPAANLKEQNRMVHQFFPYSACDSAVITPKSSSKVKYWIWWVILGLAVIILGVKMYSMVEFIQPVILSATILLTIFIFWGAVVRIFGANRAGVKICPDCVIISGVHNLTIHTQKISRGKIERIKVEQNLFQRLSGECSVVVAARGIRRSVKCKHLGYNRTIEAVKRVR